MLTTTERQFLYDKCFSDMTAFKKRFPVLTFDEAFYQKRILTNFFGGHITMETHADDGCFVVTVTPIIEISNRFAPGTQLVVNPNLKPSNGDFVLVYVHEQLKVLFRKYVIEDYEVALESTVEELQATALTYQDKIIGVVTESRLDFPL